MAIVLSLALVLSVFTISLCKASSKGNQIDDLAAEYYNRKGDREHGSK